jgi:hypothetical protein
MAASTKKKKETTPSEKGWGGRREGAGRKKGTKMVENPISEHLSFRVTADTLRRVKALREMTKEDDLSFNRQFELWVKDIAQDYGIE